MTISRDELGWKGKKGRGQETIRKRKLGDGLE